MKPTRIIYTPKASREERNAGLDRTMIVSIMKVWKENNTTKEEKLAELLVDMDTLLKKDIDVCGMSGKKDSEWSIVLFGKHLMEKYQKDFASIIGMETESTMLLRILNWLDFLLIKEYTVDVKLEKENGGNLVVNVKDYSRLITTIKEKTAFHLGVKNAVLGTQLKISVKDGSNFHPTCKPLKLMEYLCELTKTPTGGIVLDPFGGSGTTGIACKKTKRDYILIEKEEEYCKIAEARIRAQAEPLF